MRQAHSLEERVGMGYYVSRTPGTGGRLRAADDHFQVREREQFSIEPLSASADAYSHLVFRATLSGWETNDFAARLSDLLGVSRERISWAGTKDKRAVTTQLFTVSNVEPTDMAELNRAEIDVIGRSGRAIEFGDLAGNDFTITVTETTAPERAADITTELASFGGRQTDSTASISSGTTLPDEENGDEQLDSDEPVSIGVPNYFGQQRFGSRRPITHTVGLAIIRSDWEGAVMSYLGKPMHTEPDATQAARTFVEDTRDWQEALERFPRGLRYERAMLHELASHDEEPDSTAYRAALEQLPRNLQRLFVHAAQSYAFNRMLTERLERGLPFDRPIDGDVVCFADESAPPDLVVPDPQRTQRVDDRRVEMVTRHCERNRAFVTAPLVGTETELADGEQGEIERDVLADLDLSPADFDLPGVYHSTGTRRAILLRTDVELTIEASDPEPLQLSFSLPKGSYATVVLREYLKTDPINLG